LTLDLAAREKGAVASSFYSSPDKKKTAARWNAGRLKPQR
jgi:hypothetical protein